MVGFRPTAENVIENKGPLRLTELIDETGDELKTRRELAKLEADGEIKRFVVGDHVFLDSVSEGT